MSEKHANFIVNDQGGSASDVRRLADGRAHGRARETGIDLRYEIVFAGDWSGWEPSPPPSRLARWAAP